MRHPTGRCALCGRPGFRQGGLDIRAWSRAASHPKTKVHLYRFEHANRGWILRICTVCIRGLLDFNLIERYSEESVLGKSQVAMSRGGVGGELGSPTRGTRKEAVV